jgi:nucleotidyltransferase substrate binding protein (TIGR01987 family)
MSKKDIRWVQRFSNFRRAIEKLRDAVAEYDDDMSDLEKEGIVQRFEYTFELGWKTLQDLLVYRGYVDVKGPNPVLAQALLDGYIKGEKIWREMKQARDATSHTYDEKEANEIVEKIVSHYCKILTDLHKRLEKELKKEK